MQSDLIYDCTSRFAHSCAFRASHFTGKERDAESGLDYFGARYYASNMGRFMSPDWSAKTSPVPYARLTDPQTLNLYSFVTNTPLTNIDRDGHDITVRGRRTEARHRSFTKSVGIDSCC